MSAYSDMVGAVRRALEIALEYPMAAQTILQTAYDARWKCGANRSADPPQDCGWPTCGCDPTAQEAICAVEDAIKPQLCPACLATLFPPPPAGAIQAHIEPPGSPATGT